MSSATGRFYTATGTITLTAARDCVQIEAVNRLVMVRQFTLGQTSDYGDAEAEGLPIRMCRFSGGVTNTVTEQRLDQANSVATSDIAEDQAQATSTGLLLLDVWNIQLPYIWSPPEEYCPIITIGDSIAFGIDAAPSDSLTAYWQLMFEEIGA